MRLFVRIRPTVQLRVQGITQDRRSPQLLGAAAALEQARTDQLLESRWRTKVGDHAVERARILRGDGYPLPSLTTRQAE